nr:hypothetical protein Iba_chr11dCG1370 [Ipomoea batatas]
MHSKTTNAQYKSMSPVTNSRILTLQVIEQKSEPPDNPMPLKTENNEASSVDLNFKSAIKKQKYKLKNRVNNGMSEYRRTRFSPFFFARLLSQRFASLMTVRSDF